MGIYPTDEFKSKWGSDLITRTENWFDGKVKTTYYMPILVIEERTNCFCCSCGDREGSDPACRNHGFAATRPCEEHDMPGSVWDDDGTMPESVQEIRRQEKAREDA